MLALARPGPSAQVNMEHFQVLNYQPGQFYLTHHDYIPEHQKSPCGPRLATFFIYLSDVEEGGGTYFPQLQQTVMPKKGRAALWCVALTITTPLLHNRGSIPRCVLDRGYAGTV